MENTLSEGSLLKNGEYRIVNVLGQGGFGITYEAVQVSLNRKVAVKEFFMKDCCERDTETSQVSVGTGTQRELVFKFRSKFIREAQMIAEMEHPNIVRIIDVFEENGTAYYVMENLPGGSLTDKVKKEGRFSESQAEKYIRQVASALSYIHDQKTVHLDVKPSNILLNKNGKAVLIDFGISKHYDKAGEQTSSTPVGISKGYAPLEQGSDGDVSQFTPATDIYALGATLYYLVSGQVPPEASLIYEDGLDRPAEISDRMWNVIEKAMQPRRKERPQNVEAFLSLLDAAPASASNASKDESEETIVNVVPAKKPEEKKPAAPAPQKLVEPAPKKPFPKWLIGVVVALVAALVVGCLLAWLIVPRRTNPTVELEQTGISDGHEWVDLGLSVKWATCNVGASSPSDYGSYYAWGETSPKSDYSWSTLKYCSDTTGDSFTKYNTKSKYGTVDKKTRLDMSDDAARQNWGGKWRMPTDAEWTELREKCTWTWTTRGGHNGYKVTSKQNGNSIFLSAAGGWEGMSLGGVGVGGSYWSSSLDTDVANGAWLVFFNSSDVIWSSGGRFLGLSVRPVSE